MFQSLITPFIGKIAPKATQKKEVQSRLRDKSPEQSGSIEEYPMSTDSVPLVPCQTHDRL